MIAQLTEARHSGRFPQDLVRDARALRSIFTIDRPRGQLGSRLALKGPVRRFEKDRWRGDLHFQENFKDGDDVERNYSFRHLILLNGRFPGCTQVTSRSDKLYEPSRKFISFGDAGRDPWAGRAASFSSFKVSSKDLSR